MEKQQNAEQTTAPGTQYRAVGFLSYCLFILAPRRRRHATIIDRKSDTSETRPPRPAYPVSAAKLDANAVLPQCSQTNLIVAAFAQNAGHDGSTQARVLGERGYKERGGTKKKNPLLRLCQNKGNQGMVIPNVFSNECYRLSN